MSRTRHPSMLVIAALLASHPLTQAEDSLAVKLNAGWNLVGIPEAIAASKLLALNPALRNATALRSSGLVDANTLPTITRGEAVAVYSDSAITVNLPLPTTDPAQAPKLSDALSIPSGTSAHTLPVDMTISPRLFGDRAVLTWDKDHWQAFPNAAATRLGFGDFPAIQSIKAGQGFLVVGDAPLQGSLSDLASQLQPFASEKEMTAYLREQAVLNRSYHSLTSSPAPELRPSYIENADCTRSYLAYPTYTTSAVPSPTAPPAPTPAPTPTASKITNTTSTNVQELGVDESDIVKHNGRDVFYTAPRSKRILVSSFDAISSNSKPLGEIALGKCVSIEAMYLVNNRLALVTGTGDDYWSSWLMRGYSYWNRESTLDIYDVSDPLKAKKLASKKLDGAVVDSRLLDQRLHLIMRYVPYIDVEIPKIVTTTDPEQAAKVGLPNFSLTITQEDWSKAVLKTEHLVPKVTDAVTGKTTPLFKPARFYAPAKLDQASNTLSVLAFDINTGELVDQAGIFGNQDTVYMSTQNLYTVSADYPRFFGWSIVPNNETRSKIHRFSVAGGKLDYTGSAFVDGTVLNQFSLGEADKVLRIATTRRFWDKDWRNNTDNQVATFGGDGSNFVQKGLLGGLGKPGETIRSARFLGNKGYLVTFRNTDPLYTLDLSDPAKPKKVGELSIPGYSSYLHPIDDTRVLAIGRDASDNGVVQGVQIQLFDISDFAKPKLADKRLYAKDWSTRSSAESDAKAFTYRADGLLAFDLQTTNCSINAAGYFTCSYGSVLKLLKVDGMKLKDSNDLKGSDGNDADWDRRYRNILFDRDGKTWAAFLSGEAWSAGVVTP